MRTNIVIKKRILLLLSGLLLVSGCNSGNSSASNSNLSNADADLQNIISNMPSCTPITTSTTLTYDKDSCFIVQSNNIKTMKITAVGSSGTDSYNGSYTNYWEQDDGSGPAGSAFGGPGVSISTTTQIQDGQKFIIHPANKSSTDGAGGNASKVWLLTSQGSPTGGNLVLAAGGGSGGNAGSVITVNQSRGNPQPSNYQCAWSNLPPSITDIIIPTLDYYDKNGCDYRTNVAAKNSTHYNGVDGLEVPPYFELSPTGPHSCKLVALGPYPNNKAGKSFVVGQNSCKMGNNEQSGSVTVTFQ